MAAGNIRESILQAIVAKVEELDSIEEVRRRMPSGIDELRTIASIQFPFVSVVANLPKPDPKLSHRNMHPRRQKFYSQLDVNINCYFMDNQTPDVTMGNLCDDLFAKLYEDQTLGGLTQSLEVLPQDEIGVWEPYGAFRLICRVNYFHGTGGI
jgi:hypothetical protein